jgi:FixJ family two-component response regulator
MISIVDDDAFVRQAIGELVQSLGYTAATFPSAEHFLESGRVEETSCLITDLQMPGLSGLDLQSHLLAHGRRTPIIFITAFPEEKFRTRALNAGAVGFLSKPCDEDALINCLETALTGPSSKTSPASY